MKFIRLSLSRQIFIGMAAGVLCGIFLGEACQRFEIVGKVYLRLLQMNVLPYLVVSLIAGIGRISLKEVRHIAGVGSLVLLLMWAICLVLVFAMSLAFPPMPAAMFYRPSHSEEAYQRGYDLLDVYVPHNVFESLSESMIPGVVLYCLLVGFALTQVQNKNPLIGGLSALTQAFQIITKGINRVTPIGIFTLVANSVGSTRLSDLSTLQVYVLCFIATAVMLTLIILPLLVSSLTRFSYESVLNFSKDALVLGFSVGSLFVVLPLIEQRVKELFSSQNLRTDKGDSVVDVGLPVVYNFPTAGRILYLLFILYAGWYYRLPLDFWQCFDLAGTGILGIFGDFSVVIPFLLNHFHLNAEAFNMMLTVNFATIPFGTMTGVMSMIAFLTISASAVSGQLSLNWKKVLYGLLFTVVMVSVVVGILHKGLDLTTQRSAKGEVVLRNMRITDPVPATNLPPPTPGAAWQHVLALQNDDLLDRVVKRGVLRVGYKEEFPPYAYTNKYGELVGYGMALAHKLAHDLNCTIEFVPVNLTNVTEELNENAYDVIALPVFITEDRLRKFDYTDPLFTSPQAFFMPEYRKKEFRRVSDMQKMKGLRIAMWEGSYEEKRLREKFPNAEIVFIKDNNQFFNSDIADILSVSAEEGAFLTMLHPLYAVVEPEPLFGKVQCAFAIPKNQPSWSHYLDEWLGIQRTAGTMEYMYNYWILGRGAEAEAKRWSVAGQRVSE